MENKTCLTKNICNFCIHFVTLVLITFILYRFGTYSIIYSPVWVKRWPVWKQVLTQIVECCEQQTPLTKATWFFLFFKKRKEIKIKSAGAWCFAQNIQNRVLGCVQTKLDDATKIRRSVHFRRPTGSQHHQRNLGNGCNGCETTTTSTPPLPLPRLPYIPAGYGASAWFGVDAA